MYRSQELSDLSSSKSRLVPHLPTLRYSIIRITRKDTKYYLPLFSVQTSERIEYVRPSEYADPDKEGTTEDDSTEDAKEVTKKTPPPPGKEVISQKSFPSYTIEDKSAVEISVVEHQYEMSMATNDFSASIFEASV